MMKSQRPQTLHNFSLVFVLFLVCIFVLCSLFIILFGGAVYNGIRERGDEGALNTGLSYLTNKLRAYDEQGLISIESFDGEPVLALKSADLDVPYVTYIFCYDGALRELSADPSMDFDPAGGEPIVEAESLAIDALSEQALQLTLHDADGSDVQTVVTLRTLDEEVSAR